MIKKLKLVNEALEKVVLRDPLILHEAMRYSLLPGGQHLRPILCIAASELVCGVESTAMPAACAVEVIHSMILIIYDLPCMDNDHLRRGKPATHKVFGVNISALVAQALGAFAFKEICSIGVPPGRILSMIRELEKGFGSGVGGGKVVDLELTGASDVSLNQLESIHLGKAAAAMFEASVVIGAIVGGGSEEEAEKLKNFARGTGLMLQVIDDILDATKDSVTGKTTYSKLIGIKTDSRTAMSCT